MPTVNHSVLKPERLGQVLIQDRSENEYKLKNSPQNSDKTSAWSTWPVLGRVPSTRQL